MTQTLAIFTMAVWLVAVLLGFTYTAIRPRWISLYPEQVRKIALFGIGGAVGEILTLTAGGFWGPVL